MLKSSLAGPRHIPKTVKKAIVLLHGYGANGTDMFGFAPAFEQAFPDAAIYCPDALEHLPGLPGCRCWFALDGYDPAQDADNPDIFVKRCRAVLPPLEKPRALLDRMLDEMMELHGLKARDVGIGGFSQGGLVALAVA